MLKSLLIANRGEIACRIIRTARAMGIRTVAVYSDADAKALHVRQADEAVHIGPSPAAVSYLRGEKIIAAAIATKAEAIHPGYGFLSENAEFAQAVIDAGLIWVGPAPASITAMGLKDAAKKLMAAAGVPVTPGYMGENQDSDFLAAEAEKIGYPVLIKAVAGGGGKGMRKVEDAGDFADALASCQREATASFGNAHVLIEKYIQRPRHIEVQVFGDTHGNIVHLFERDCSLQRRHQKVIEEAPAPGMDEATREILCAVAVKAAKAVNYVGAGTIEFIADASEGLRADRIWFMEMNTRLQVEHPVTEEITGVDLVEWQLRVASSEPLPKRQDELSINGWAMEARLYAEDPAKGFLPSIGRLEHFSIGGYSCRLETGYEKGDIVSQYYDPMLAKIVIHGAFRERVAESLSGACACALVWPVKTNNYMLSRALDDATFVDGEVDTAFIEDRLEQLTVRLEPESKTLHIGAREVIRRHAFPNMSKRSRRYEKIEPVEPIGFRLNLSAKTSVSLQVNGETRRIEVDPARGDTAWNIEYADDLVLVSDDDGQLSEFGFLSRAVGGAGPASSGNILSPMPGRIIAVDVQQGQSVTKGQKLITLEAMKMEHSLVAPFDGIVAELNAETGAQVQVEAVLVRIQPNADKAG
jgi:3-methylcrotonyl-CoA carboxylase alpha subunit